MLWLERTPETDPEIQIHEVHRKFKFVKFAEKKYHGQNSCTDDGTTRYDVTQMLPNLMTLIEPSRIHS
jgi:hypothetical protein